MAAPLLGVADEALSEPEVAGKGAGCFSLYLLPDGEQISGQQQLHPAVWLEAPLQWLFLLS